MDDKLLFTDKVSDVYHVLIVVDLTVKNYNTLAYRIISILIHMQLAISRTS